jgi:hypothetical protein
VRFRERQLLRTADLADEQAYHLAMRRRHHLAQHGWGVVRGLRLALAGGGWTIDPGMAVDGYGRELFVAEPLRVPAEAFAQLESDRLDVWLVYDRTEETTPLRGRFDCGPGRHNRWREVTRLRLTAADERINPRAPAETPLEDIPFAPHREPPDDPAREWPVYLGVVERVVTGQLLPAPPRPSATLAGESLTAPSGRARLRIGSEEAGDPRRFSVETPDAAGTFAERLSLDRAGELSVRGDTTVGRDIFFREREGEGTETPTAVDHCSPAPTLLSEERAANAVVFSPPAPLPAEAAPWQIYRSAVVEEGRPTRQLRFELGHPADKGDPRVYRFAVGSHSSGRFHACLTVTADCLVTIAGALNVLGRVVEGPIKADPTDPRFTAELVNQWSRGAAAANTQLDDTYSRTNDLAVTVDVPGEIIEGQLLNYEPAVTNAGPSTLTNAYAYVSLVYMSGDDLIAHEQQQFGPFNLGPGESRTFPFSYAETDTVGRITINVTAIAVGALSNVLSARTGEDEYVVDVFPQIG